MHGAALAAQSNTDRHLPVADAKNKVVFLALIILAVAADCAQRPAEPEFEHLVAVEKRRCRGRQGRKQGDEKCQDKTPHESARLM